MYGRGERHKESFSGGRDSLDCPQGYVFISCYGQAHRPDMGFRQKGGVKGAVEDGGAIEARAFRLYLRCPQQHTFQYIEIQTKVPVR